MTSRVQFFLPESDDLVDQNFDFLSDDYGKDGQKGRRDVYGHQLYGRLSSDGLLVSRSTVGPAKLASIRSTGGVHSFFSVSKQTPIISDSGAFQYRSLECPPYSAEETCQFYEKLGVDYGVTLDHLIFEFDPDYDLGSTLVAREVPVEARRRMAITISEAEQMWQVHRKGSFRHKPIGAAQGWSPKSYRECVERLAEIGYDYIALGGLARASDEDIRLVLEELVRSGLSRQVKFHLFGVARLSLMEDFMKSGVVSCDSASTIFQAFKSDKDNYHTSGKNYTAVRIPATVEPMSPKVRKILKEVQNTKGESAATRVLRNLATLEVDALAKVRAYASREVSLETAMEALVRYDDQFGENRKAYRAFEETLRDRPWENCACAICREIGVEVIILRGNNRNRRRGFHNTWVFYEEFKKRRTELESRLPASTRG